MARKAIEAPPNTPDSEVPPVLGAPEVAIPEDKVPPETSSVETSLPSEILVSPPPPEEKPVPVTIGSDGSINASAEDALEAVGKKRGPYKSHKRKDPAALPLNTALNPAGPAVDAACIAAGRKAAQQSRALVHGFTKTVQPDNAMTKILAEGWDDDWGRGFAHYGWRDLPPGLAMIVSPLAYMFIAMSQKENEIVVKTWKDKWTAYWALKKERDRLKKQGF